MINQLTYRANSIFCGLTALLLLLLSFNLQPLSAQESPSYYEYPFNHLDWYTIESDHFMIHFQKGNSRSAQVVSRVAEEVYYPLTDLYGHEPDSKVSIVLKDREDYSNGAAYFFDNKIDIWVPALNTPLRGYHKWFRNVIAHEFTHIIQLQAAMKRSRHLPAMYFQWLSYEDVRRPDVLYGYPNGVITMPFATVNISAWLAEGTAQYQRQGWSFDTWDSHRDMILRTRVLSDTYLDFSEMSTFSSKNSLDRETIYNQGFAFTIYLANRFGEEVLADITAKASQKGTYEIDQAIEDATGISGHELFQDFISQKKEYYTDAVNQLSYTDADTVEGDGFYNFHSTVSPDQNTLAFLSNRGRDYSRVSLYLKNIGDSSDTKSAHIPLMKLDNPHFGGHATYSCGFSDKPLVYFISSAFSFSPDGKELIYSRQDITKYGESYSDLYRLSLNNPKKRKQLTHGKRLESPAWSPVDSTVAAIKRHDGTTNLVRYHLAADSIEQLTHLDHGQQVFNPTWTDDGNNIYFSQADTSKRSIWVYDLESRSAKPVLQHPYIDYRNPKVGPDQQYLYYSSDTDGIYNIYRIPLAGGEQEKLTSVLGGAFMPEVTEDGTLYYSEFVKDGYKIMSTPLQQLYDHTHMGSYQPAYEKSENDSSVFTSKTSLRHFNDKDIEPLSQQVLSLADTTHYSYSLSTRLSSDERSVYRYEDTITGFTFFPVLRFDNYSQPYGTNRNLIKAGNWGDVGKNLVRDVKLGTYFSSRQVNDKLSVFGGAMFGFGSRPAEGLNDFFKPQRLINMDRDLFFIADYQGLPFIKRYWSPTVSIELYNLRRNVKDGLTVEEFPCTSCLPDTTKSDIAYDVWEANLLLRSKLNRWNMVELGIAYSPYQVSTDGFVSKELKQYVPGSTSQYFKGTRLSASYIFEMYEPYKHSDIAPIGTKGFAKYTYEPTELLDNYEIEDGTLSPVYESFNNHSIELEGRYGFKVFNRITAQVHSRFFSYFNNPDDYFYLDYIGGFSGMRSYPFFALGGNTTAFATGSVYAPLVTGINKQFGPYTFDKMYARIFAETGNGWRGPLDINKSLKTGVGAELRFAFNGFYLFPMKLYLSGSYGFNTFDVKLPEDFITGSSSNRVSYGDKVLFHFGITFDFEAL